jgi:hypothetical protein
MHKYIVHKDELFERYDDALFKGYVRTRPQVTKMDPYLSYVGPKIPMESWKQILGFFDWAYKEHKVEAQVRLYLNQKQGTWRAWAFPQEGEAAATMEIAEACDVECKKTELYSAKGWIEAGTVHSHAAMSAFQSGTDKSNEDTKQGIHITVGKLDERVYDRHGRLTFRGIFYNVDWSDWFQLPPGLEGLPAPLYSTVMQYFLTQHVTETAFPDTWKENLKKKEWVPKKWARSPELNWPAWIDESYPIDAEQEQPHLVDAKLERVGNQILQACAAKGVDVIRLFQCAEVGAGFCDPTALAEEELLDELETICFKEGVTLADLEALIIAQSNKT